MRYFGSASGRRCSSTSITRTPAVRHSSLQLVDPPGRVGAHGARHPLRPRGAANVDDHQQRAIAFVGRDHRRRDALELLLERLDQRVRVQRRCVKNGSVGRMRQAAGPRPAAAGGRRADRPGARRARRRSPPPDPGAAAPGRRDRRASAARCEGACAPGAGPRKRPRPARIRPISGRLIRDASPTKTCSISPRRPTRIPTWRSISARYAAQVRRELRRRDLGGTEPPPVNALERVFLARLEPGGIAADDVQAGEVSTSRIFRRIEG